LTVGGTANLGGTVEINFEKGFSANLGDQFQILLSLAQINGDFARLEVAPLTNGLTFAEILDLDGGGHVIGISLEVVASNPPSVPEPPAIAMMLLGTLVLFAARIRRNPSNGFPRPLRAWIR
jgi:hypothetical protein